MNVNNFNEFNFWSLEEPLLPSLLTKREFSSTQKNEISVVDENAACSDLISNQAKKQKLDSPQFSPVQEKEEGENFLTDLSFFVGQEINTFLSQRDWVVDPAQEEKISSEQKEPEATDKSHLMISFSQMNKKNNIYKGCQGFLPQLSNKIYALTDKFLRIQIQNNLPCTVNLRIGFYNQKEDTVSSYFVIKLGENKSLQAEQFCVLKPAKIKQLFVKYRRLFLKEDLKEAHALFKIFENNQCIFESNIQAVEYRRFLESQAVIKLNQMTYINPYQTLNCQPLILLSKEALNRQNVEEQEENEKIDLLLPNEAYLISEDEKKILPEKEENKDLQLNISFSQKNSEQKFKSLLKITISQLLLFIFLETCYYNCQKDGKNYDQRTQCFT